MTALSARLPRLVDSPRRPARLVAGLGAVAAVVAGAFVVTAVALPVSALVVAVALGAVAAPWARRRPALAPGVTFAGRTLLRAGVALLGLRISIGEIGTLGVSGIALAVGTVALTFALVLGVGRLLGVPHGLTMLIAAGTAICGASAVAAMGDAIRAKSADVAYAVGIVTLFGTVAMVVWPLAGTAVFGLDDHQTGTWVGASIHEVAQATAGGAAVSMAALEAAVLMKLARVVLLAPTIAVATIWGGAATRGLPRVPWFVVAFAGFVALRSAVEVPNAVLEAAAHSANALLAAGLAALGLQLQVGALRAAGWRPMVLGLAASLGVAMTSLVLLLALP